MPLNSENQSRNEEEKKILQGKEIEASFADEEILRVKEKIKAGSFEEEKNQEKRENGKEKAVNRDTENTLMTKRQSPTPQQLKTLTDQTNNANISHYMNILVNMALNKSIYQAIKVARKIGNAYLLDRFHDIIVNELFEDLAKKKKIKPIK